MESFKISSAEPMKIIVIDKINTQHVFNNMYRQILNTFNSVFQKNSDYKIIHKNCMEKITSTIDIVYQMTLYYEQWTSMILPTNFKYAP